VFSIRFLPEPAFPYEGSGPLHRYGIVVMDSFEERFLAPLEDWREHDYERQWVEGAARIAGGSQSSCLVTKMHEPGDKDWLRWWALYRLEGDVVAVQEHMHLPEWGLVDPKDPYSAIGEYDNEEDDPVSEWRLTVEDFRQFASGS
jgi:CdiI N-terminal domain